MFLSLEARIEYKVNEAVNALRVAAGGVPDQAGLCRPWAPRGCMDVPRTLALAAAAAAAQPSLRLFPFFNYPQMRPQLRHVAG